MLHEKRQTRSQHSLQVHYNHCLHLSVATVLLCPLQMTDFMEEVESHKVKWQLVNWNPASSGLLCFKDQR